MKKGSDKIKLTDISNFLELKNFLITQNKIYEEIFNDKSVKFFLNLEEITDVSIKLNDGDEIAFLPPVTGG